MPQIALTAVGFPEYEGATDRFGILSMLLDVFSGELGKRFTMIHL
jgi:hypothetical protein